MDIDQILDSGDPEAMEALLNSADAIADDDGELLSVELNEQAVDSAAAGAGAGDEATDEDSDSEGQDAEGDQEELPAAAEGAAEDEAPRFILSKDGKHQIPYEVLETTRSRVTEYKTLAEQHAAEKTELEKQLAQTKQLLELRSDQLKSNAIDPRELPEAMAFDDAKLKAIEEEYGELGVQQVALIRQLQHLQQQVTQTASQRATEPTANPVETAIAGNQDLNTWRDSDPDRWDFAVSVDNKLRDDPNFKDMALNERFAEAVRRTKAAFGDAIPADAQAKANAVIDAATPTTPRSLTDVSASAPDSEKSLIERLADQGVDDIAAAMEGMTDAQIDALLEQGIY